MRHREADSLPQTEKQKGVCNEKAFGGTKLADYIGAIDQGTTSTRFIVFERSGRTVAVSQKEHKQIYPKPGWVEHNAEEIWQNTRDVIAQAMAEARLRPRDLAAIGITNQRETTVVWNRKTGKPVANALVWQDTRVADYVRELAESGGQDRFRAKTGLPLTTYFSGLKIRWILDHVEGAREAAEAMLDPGLLVHIRFVLQRLEMAGDLRRERLVDFPQRDIAEFEPLAR